jgi:hypothetical protein
VPFAFDEFIQLAPSVSLPTVRDDPKLWYVASMIADLCYYHVPQFEIDSGKRVKLVPSDAYREIVRIGFATDVRVYLATLEEYVVRYFVIEDRGAIAVGIQVTDRLFVGFRGTVFLYDWWINFRARFTDFGYPFYGRFHNGFFEEAVRMSVLLEKELSRIQQETHRDRGTGIRGTAIEEIIISGHSLGGAVGALCGALSREFSRNMGRPSIRTAVLFGAPRYCDASGLFNQLRDEFYPIQIKRPGDAIPSVPPRSLGYVDQLYEYNTSGQQAPEALTDTRLSYLVLRWLLFLGKGFEPHKMEKYRQELGAHCSDAKYANEPLIDREKLKPKNLGEAPVSDEAKVPA